MADLTPEYLNWLEQRLRAGGYSPAEIQERLVQAQQHQAGLAAREVARAADPLLHGPYGANPPLSVTGGGPGRTLPLARTTTIPTPQGPVQAPPELPGGGAVPSIEDVAARERETTPEEFRPPKPDPSKMPTTDTEEAPRTQLTTYVDEEGRVVMGNQAPAGAQTLPYEAGLQAWKENAMRQEANRAEMRRLMREGGNIERPGETITVVPPSPFQGRTRPAPTMGREMGDFRVREGRGGFTPSAPVPTAGTITQEEYQNLTPGQQAAYDREYAKWAQREAVQRELDPLRAYNQAAEQIMRDFPEVQTKLDAYKATLQPYLDDEQITPEMYAMMVEGKKRQLVNEAMMAAGASAASMDPRTHQRTGVMGGLY